MQNPIAAKPLYIRIPLIILILGSSILIFDFLPESLGNFTSLGYLGLFTCNLYMLWIMYQAKQSHKNKATS